MICPWTIVYPKSHAIKIFFVDEGECDIFIYDYNHICQSYHHNILSRWDWISSHLHLIKISSAGEGGCDLQTSKQASQQGRHQSLSRRQQPQVFYCQSFCQQYNPVSSNNNNSYGHPSKIIHMAILVPLRDWETSCCSTKSPRTSTHSSSRTSLRWWLLLWWWSSSRESFMQWSKCEWANMRTMRWELYDKVRLMIMIWLWICVKIFVASNDNQC